MSRHRVLELKRFEAADALRRLGGRATRAQLLAHTTKHHVAVAIRAGRVASGGRGIYTLADLPAANACAARARGVLSHASAAQELRLEMVFPPDAVHVTVPRGARPPSTDGVVHHHGTLAAGDLAGQHTSVARTVLDCATTMPFTEALAVADSALRRYPGLQEQLLSEAHQRWGPGRGRRLAGFEPQVKITIATGTVRVDLADAARRIVIEADSFEWHGDRRALASDCRRYAELTRAGWIVLRFAWEHVMFDPEWVAAVVTDVVGICPSSPG